MERHDQPDELRDAPILRGLSKDDPFAVPDGFFDRFPHAMQAHIAHREAGGVTRTTAWWSALLLPRSIAAMAMISALVLVAWQIWPTTEEPAVLAETAAIEPEELPWTAVNSDMLYETLGEEGFSSVPMDLPTDTDVLFAYLENEDLDLDLLTEEL